MELTQLSLSSVHDACKCIVSAGTHLTCARPCACMQGTDSKTCPLIPKPAPMPKESKWGSVIGFFKKLLQRQDPSDDSPSPACPFLVQWDKAFLHHGLVL